PPTCLPIRPPLPRIRRRSVDRQRRRPRALRLGDLSTLAPVRRSSSGGVRVDRGSNRCLGVRPGRVGEAPERDRSGLDTDRGGLSARRASLPRVPLARFGRERLAPPDRARPRLYSRLARAGRWRALLSRPTGRCGHLTARRAWSCAGTPPCTAARTAGSPAPRTAGGTTARRGGAPARPPPRRPSPRMKR